MTNKETDEKEDNALFKLIHMMVLEIAKNKLKIKLLQGFLKEKNLISQEELEKSWSAIIESDLKEVFEEIEKNIGFENVKLKKEDEDYIISGLDKS